MRNKILSIVLMFVLFMGLLYYGGNSKVYAAELPNVVKKAQELLTPKEIHLQDL